MGDNQKGGRRSRLLWLPGQDKAKSSRSPSRPSTIGRLRSSRSGSLRSSAGNWSLPRSRSTAREEDHHAKSAYERGAVGKISLRLWLTAYENVAKAHPKMMEAYEKILTYHVGGDDQLSADITEESPNRFEQLEPDSRISKHHTIVSNALQEAKEHCKLHQGIEYLSDFLKYNGEKIGNLMTAHPASALVWSGICIALQLVSGPASQGKVLQEGLEYVTNRMEWYLALAELLLEKSWKESSDFQRYHEVMQKKVVEMYERLLGLEIKSVCRCHERTRIVRLLKDVLHLDSIEVAIEELKDLEGQLHRDTMQYTTDGMVHYLEQIAQSARALKPMAKDMSELVQAQRRQETAEQQRWRSDLIARLATTAYTVHLNKVEQRLPKTCEWLHGHKNFSSWVNDSENRVLLVSAEPGCGKSVLAKYLVEEKMPTLRSGATVCYFFFKDKAERRELSHALCAVLHQLFRQRRTLVDIVEKDIQESGASLTENWQMLWQMLIKACSNENAGDVFCILDALDECNPSSIEVLIRLLGAHAQTQGSSASRLKFLVTTRGYPRILDRFNDIRAGCVQIDVSESSVLQHLQDEIDIVVDHNVDAFASNRKLKPELKDLLRIKVKERGGKQRTYLWTWLIFQALNKERDTSETAILNLISHLPDSVFGAYEALLAKVQPNEQAKVDILIALVVGSMRPLTLQEVNLALHVRDRQRVKPDGHLSLMSDGDFQKWIIETCGYFVTTFDGCVYLIHKTAEDFIQGDDDGGCDAKMLKYLDFQSGNKVWKGSIPKSRAHAIVAESCVAYLSLKSFRSIDFQDEISRLGAAAPVVSEKSGSIPADAKLDLGSPPGEKDQGYLSWFEFLSDLESLDAVSADHLDSHLHGVKVNTESEPIFRRHGFLSYAVQHWPNHFRESQVFSQSETELSVTDIHEDFWEDYWSLFHARFGEEQPWLRLYRSSQDHKSIMNEVGWTCSYHVAALFGHYRLLKSTVPRPVHQLYSDGHSDASALLLAVASQVEQCVSLAIEHAMVYKLDYTRQDGDRNTWLHLAAKDNAYGVVEKHLREPAVVDIINTRNRLGQTPLHVACMRDGFETVLQLLEGKAKINAKDNKNNTPLHLAAERGDLKAVALLLDRGARISTYNECGETPLHRACSQERLDVVRALVEKGADINSRRDFARGDTALIVAIGHSHPDVVIWLIENGASVTALNALKHSPLHAVSMRSSYRLASISAEIKQQLDAGRMATLDVLWLERPDEAHARDLITRTLLQNGASTSCTAADGSTPLHFAAEWGLEDQIELLLEYGASVNPVTETGQTPLHWAARSVESTFDCVTLLLQRGALLDAVDHKGQTPLHKASKHGRSLPQLSLLLHGAYVQAKDRKGRTPLSLAEHNDSVFTAAQLRDCGKLRSKFGKACRAGVPRLSELLAPPLNAAKLLSGLVVEADDGKQVVTDIGRRYLKKVYSDAVHEENPDSSAGELDLDDPTPGQQTPTSTRLWINAITLMFSIVLVLSCLNLSQLALDYVQQTWPMFRSWPREPYTKWSFNRVWSSTSEPKRTTRKKETKRTSKTRKERGRATEGRAKS